MSHSLASPSPTLRGFLARAWADPDARSITIGVLGVVLIHLLLWLLAPLVLRFEPTDMGAQRPHAMAKTFNIELAPETFAKPLPKLPPPMKFVETNPDAPENTPDKTQNFSDRNQQVAQEKPTPDGNSDRPATEGKKDFESTQIVSGRLTNPLERAEPVPPPQQEVQEQPAAAVPKAEQNPLPGFEKREGENKDGLGSNVAKFPDNVRPIPERIEGDKLAPLIQGATGLKPSIDPKRPQPRPMLQATQQVRPAVLAQNDFGTKNMGPVAYDAKWSEYGEYLRRMIDAVYIQWERYLTQATAAPPSGTFVTVKFIIDAEGKIPRIVSVDNQSSKLGENAAVSAITERAPYGAWSEEMRNVLGAQQELTFVFHYQ